MVRILSESDVRQHLTMSLALESVECAFRSLGGARGANLARERLFPDMGPMVATSLQLMAATLTEWDAMGLKAYGTGQQGASFVVLLFRASTGELRGILAADWLGRYRTGAATGYASRLLARPDSTTVTVLGTGGQAATQVLAVATALPMVRHVRVWNRTVSRRDQFARVFEEVAGPSMPKLSFTTYDDAEDAVRGSDIVVAITSARTPILKGEWLSPGMHIVGAGINRANAAEIDDEAIARCDVVVVDQLVGAMRESGDLIHAVNAGKFAWTNAVELGAVASGGHPGRTSATQITLFESQGLAIEDVALATRVLERAEAEGQGAFVAL